MSNQSILSKLFASVSLFLPATLLLQSCQKQDRIHPAIAIAKTSSLKLGQSAQRGIPIPNFGTFGIVSTLISGLQTGNLAEDAAGNLYMAVSEGNVIVKITAGVKSVLAGTGAAGFVDGGSAIAQFNFPTGIAVDASGNVYVAESANHAIRKITPSGVVSTLAGNGTAGYVDSAGAAARFTNPGGLAVDASGTIYVADAGNHVIRKITPAGVVSTLAGNIQAGFVDGTGSAAKFGNPIGVAVDVQGTVYVADENNSAIRVITPGGSVTTLAGNGTAGFVDSTGTAAEFNFPLGVTIDPHSGAIYVADFLNNRIRSVTPGGVVTNLAGNGLAGSTDTVGSAAAFNRPSSVVADAAGNVFVADGFNLSIRKIKVITAGAVSTFAGSATAGNADGTIATAQFSSPAGVASDVSGNIYIADQGNQRIRKITPDGSVGTLAGSIGGFREGTGTAARFNTPSGLAVDGFKNVYVADQINQRIRKISAEGVVTTLAGNGTRGFVNGSDTAARFNFPAGVAVDGSGTVYVADASNNAIRKITPDGVVTTLAGNGVAGFINGGPAAEFKTPVGVAVDGSGNVYVADKSNHSIREITPGGVVTTLAGTGKAGFADGAGNTAQFNSPVGVSVDGAGNVFVIDQGNQRIRKITPQGVVSTLDGNGTAGFINGVGPFAEFKNPAGLVVCQLISQSGLPLGPVGLLVCDQGNNSIRFIQP